MEVKSVPTLGWRKQNVAATILQVTDDQRRQMAERLRVLMEAQRHTNVSLARKADVSEKTISRLVNAKREPRNYTVERVARALGISELELTGPPPAPLGLGAKTQLDRIEEGIKAILDLLTPDDDDQDEPETPGLVAGAAAPLLNKVRSQPRKAPKRQASPTAARRRGIS